MGVDGEYHLTPDPKAKHHNVRPGGYVPGATEEDRRVLADAIRLCEEAAGKGEKTGAPQEKPKWATGCDLSWHDDGIGLLIRLPDGREASACLECLAEAPALRVLQGGDRREAGGDGREGREEQPWTSSNS